MFNWIKFKTSLFSANLCVIHIIFWIGFLGYVHVALQAMQAFAFRHQSFPFSIALRCLHSQTPSVCRSTCILSSHLLFSLLFLVIPHTLPSMVLLHILSSGIHSRCLSHYILLTLTRFIIDGSESNSYTMYGNMCFLGCIPLA